MESYTVTILPENRKVRVVEGTNLMLAAFKAELNIDSSCGGQGTCGKCAVKVISGSVEDDVDGSLPQELKDEGYVLACLVKVTGNMIIEIPQFSRLTKHKVLLTGKHTKYSKENDYFTWNKMDPLTKKAFIKLKAPELYDGLNDLDRLKSVLMKEKNYKNLKISLECLGKLPNVVRNGTWEVTATITQTGKTAEIIDVEPGRSKIPAYGIAVDIGTTTVVALLIELEHGKVIDKEGTYNKQSAYGSDIISRIVYTDENENGLSLLQNAVIGTINELVDKLAIRNNLKSIDISTMVCAGNTVMTHFLMKVPATYLRLEPYIPAATKFPTVKAKEINININPAANVVTLPSVASYVGGDISAGVLATMFTHSDKLTLFIDIGTNGELVLGNSNWLVTCSCSAGPAFEGSGITCGMRAMDGAIKWIEIDRDSFEVKFEVIGNVNPMGICGSGLIYSLSEMMRAGVIDRAGKIFDNKTTNRVRIGSEGTEFVLVFADESGTGYDIVLTDGDIKNLLRAKASIFAGIRTMLQQMNLDVNDVSRVYIAGGFGNYMNIVDSISIGLLPDLPVEKFEYVGNSCIQGAMIGLLHKEALKEVQKIADKMTYIELSIGNTFMEEFISALFIPHTDIELFPSIARKEKELVYGSTNSSGR